MVFAMIHRGVLGSIIAVLLLAFASTTARADDVIRRLPTEQRVVALTFDACEQRAPKKLDDGIADYLVSHKIPFTIFMAGTFARDNAAEVKKLSSLGFV